LFRDVWENDETTIRLVSPARIFQMADEEKDEFAELLGDDEEDFPFEEEQAAASERCAMRDRMCSFLRGTVAF